MPVNQKQAERRSLTGDTTTPATTLPAHRSELMPMNADTSPTAHTSDADLPDNSGTALRRILRDESSSAIRKYSQLNVGRDGFWPLLMYELRTVFLGGLPGAVGFFFRQKLYRRMWQSCGRGVVIGRNVVIRHPHRIRIGRNVIIDDGCVLDGKGDGDTSITIGDNVIIGRHTILSCKGGTISIGSGTNISVNCTMISETTLDIGERIMVAGHCYMIAGGNHGMDRLDVAIADQPSIQKGGVRIGSHGWVGAGATILDGSDIGEGAVVAAGAVVNRPVESYAIVGGVPAKVLRHRDRTRGTDSD